MPHPVMSLASKPSNIASQEDAFKNMLEDHLNHFKTLPSKQIDITLEQGVRCRGDFYLLLVENKVPPDLHWLTMRFNDYKSPEEFTGDRTAFAIPNEEEYARLFQIYLTKENVI